MENNISYWIDDIPRPTKKCHKYKRGSVLVVGGGSSTSGAARLGARAALRVGAGVVTTAFPSEALEIYASHQTSVMNAPFEGEDGLKSILDKGKFNSFLIGPGHGVGKRTQTLASILLNEQKPTVLDADALTSFENNTDLLFPYVNSHTVLTPHEGEFKKLFPDIKLENNKKKAVIKAAELSGAYVLLKGVNSILSSPNGETISNNHSTPYLATAGSGDVLAGIIVGLLAGGMDVLNASSCAMWIHGECGLKLGSGLIAEDLVEVIPEVLKHLNK